MRSLPAQISEAARALQGAADTQETLDLAVQLAVDVVPACEDAAVTVVESKKTLTTPAASSEVVLLVDQLQYESLEGPCISAVHDEPLVSVPDIETDRRWPVWARATVERTSVRSMLCFRLYTEHQRVGALNLYARRPHAFTGADVDAGTAFATQVSVATAYAREVEQMHGALDSRNLVGQAQGILMERYGIDASQALAALKRVSQNSNRKLHTIAAELVETRSLPEAQTRSTAEPRR